MKKLLVVFFVLLSINVFADDRTADAFGENVENSKNKTIALKKNDTFWQSKLRPNHIVDLTLEPGVGTYIGKFYNTLSDAGAYHITPTFDLYISLFIIRYFGMQALVSSSCVIHPRSTEPEGTILYMAIEAFGIYEWKYVFLKGFAGVGYEHPTWLMQKYASGFMEAGIAVAGKINDYLAIDLSCKYRMGFLHIVQLMRENLRLMSITASVGVVCRIANRMK